jgi:hypothetical protein
MASLILSTAGNAAFGPVGGFIGALAGSAIDNAAISALTPARVQPSRLSGLRVQASQEGAPIPIAYGRFRVAGQVIWASKFDEVNAKRTVGGKGGQRVVERSYTISFAIGLCEGAIDGIGKVWANGNLLDLSTLPHRVYLGGEDQMPEPLIEAIEGLNNAPAFRGLAYVVFEDLPLGSYGDRIPQLAFEVMASVQAATTGAPRLADLARGVCLIPGAGEFVYATTPIRKILSAGDEVGENVHVQAGRADFDVALDNLSRDFPNVDAVSLVVAWFGTDLRAGQCQILPKVEDGTKQTTPRSWSVAGLSRANASLISSSGGKPAYGGSPDDRSVIEAIVALKSRGMKVTHNPFVMMDIPAGNTLANPLGGASQAPYPWRGRITCFPGIGQAGTVDGSAAATTQVNTFFGNALASHFSMSGGDVVYSGPSEWSYRRFILHQAALTIGAGGVDSFLIGSELIGLTRVRGAGGSFPAVAALIALAGEVRALLGPSVKVSYGADWTEYGGYAPPSTNDLHFPLDALWANSNIDYIGLDWYAPLTDRRDSDPRADLLALQAGIEGGEAYDFYYASDADRLAKTRSMISDGAYQEHWVWRQKDVRGFWSNAHFERMSGVRATTPTPWVAKSKPIALMELGFPAVDKGANRPSVFPDPKSAESGLPPFSNGARDDVEQRLALEATLTYWRDHNPASNVYSGPMMDMSRCHIWAWDGRPFPYFPGLTDVWSDGAYAMLGHWLAGRAGTLSLASLVGDICARGGLVDVNVDGITGYVDGFAIEAPSSPRNILENLMIAFGLEASSNSQGLFITDARPALAQLGVSTGDMTIRNGVISLARTSQDLGQPSAGRFSSFASERDYYPATYTTPTTGTSGQVNALASPIVLDPATRIKIAGRLARATFGKGVSATLSPALVARLEIGDRIAFGDDAVWRVDRMEGALSQTISASPAPDVDTPTLTYLAPAVPAQPALFSPPVLVVLDLCAPYTTTSAPMPLVGATSRIWPGQVEVLVGDKRMGTLTKPITYGTLTSAQPSQPVGRLINRSLDIELAFGASLPARGQAALAQGSEVIDVISWRSAAMVSAGEWQVSGWVRGLGGEPIGVALPVGTKLILLDDSLQEMPFDLNLSGATLTWQARPLSDMSLVTTQEVQFDAIGRQPWPPCHVLATRTSTAIKFSWVRRARGNGDSWGSANAPLGATTERYQLSILSQAGVSLRVVTVADPTYSYVASNELTDFGGVQSLIQVEVRQIGDDDLIGRAVIAALPV